MLLGVAAADSIVFVEWFGSAEPNPKSPSHTERRIGEPGLRAFFARLTEELRAQIEREAGDEPRRQGLGLTIADLPTATALRPHLGPGTTRVGHDERGFLLSHSGTLPHGDRLLVGLIGVGDAADRSCATCRAVRARRRLATNFFWYPRA